MAIRPPSQGFSVRRSRSCAAVEVAPCRREHAALGVGLRREDVERDRGVGFAEALDGDARVGDGGIEIEAGLGVESRQQQPQLAPAHLGRRADLAGHGVRAFERLDGLVGVASLELEHAADDQRARQRACGHRPAAAHVGDGGGGFGGAARPLVGLGGQGQPPRIAWPGWRRAAARRPRRRRRAPVSDVARRARRPPFRHRDIAMGRALSSLRTQVVCSMPSGAFQPLVRLRRIDVVDRCRIVHGHAHRVGRGSDGRPAWRPASTSAERKRVEQRRAEDDGVAVTRLDRRGGPAARASDARRQQRRHGAEP